MVSNNYYYNTFLLFHLYIRIYEYISIYIYENNAMFSKILKTLILVYIFLV